MPTKPELSAGRSSPPSPLQNALLTQVPPFLKEDIVTEWLEPYSARAALRAALTNQLLEDAPLFCQQIALMQCELWEAEHQLHPFPDIIVARTNEHLIGGLCGYRQDAQNYFFIQHLAVADDYTSTGSRQLIAECLVESAMDASLKYGYHGWIACSPEEKDAGFWRKLGLHPYDDLTYRRMGYFS